MPNNPPSAAIHAAVEAARRSPCVKDQRGAAVFHESSHILVSGHNAPPEPFVCSGTEECKAACGKPNEESGKEERRQKTSKDQGEEEEVNMFDIYAAQIRSLEARLTALTKEYGSIRSDLEHARAHGPWVYRWQDGAAVLTHRPPDARCSRALGELWLSVNSVSARYVWGAWDGGGSCWRSWILAAAKQSPSYVVDKLCYGHPNLYDAEASDKAVRQRILAERRARISTKEQARAEITLWEEHSPENEYQAAEWGRVNKLAPWWFEIVKWTRFGVREFTAHLPHLIAAIEVDLASNSG